MYCSDLTRRAREGKIDRVIGRDKEIERVIQILSRRSKNNPCLVLKNMKKGKPVSEIAEILDEDETVIRQIFICHEEHPDWTSDQIAKLFIKMKS